MYISVLHPCLETFFIRLNWMVRAAYVLLEKNEALNDTGMPDRQANEHMCTLWFQGCRQEKNGAK